MDGQTYRRDECLRTKRKSRSGEELGEESLKKLEMTNWIKQTDETSKILSEIKS